MAFEGLIVGLVLCVFVCFMVLLAQIKPDWRDVFDGFLPSKVSWSLRSAKWLLRLRPIERLQTIFGPQALYTSVGIIGATVMPHGLFLGSHLATIDRLDTAPRPPSGFETSSSATTTTENEVSFVPMTSRGTLEGWMEYLKRRAGPLVIKRRWKRSDAPEQLEVPSSYNAGKSPVRAITRDKEELEAAYKRDIGQFNRIKFAKVHIAHATVRMWNLRSFCPGN